MRHGGFPAAFLSHLDSGTVSRLPSGQTLREYKIVAMQREIEVAPGVFFPASRTHEAGGMLAPG